MANQVTITGHIALTESSRPVPNLKVEIWDTNQNSGYGWLASSPSDIAGNFVIIINDPIASLIANTTISLVYKVYNDCVFISQGTVSSYSQALSIFIVDSVYDALITDCTLLGDNCSYLSITGRIIDMNGVPIVGTPVNIYENGFRTKVLIGTTNTVVDGRYQIKINPKVISNTVVLAARGIRVEVVDNESNLLVASTDYFTWEGSCDLVVNLATSTATGQSYFQTVVASIQAIIGTNTSIASITVDPTNNIDEIRYLAGATGLRNESIQYVVSAYQFASVGTLLVDIVYAIVLAKGSGANPLQYVTETDIRLIVSDALAANIISGVSTSVLNTFVVNARAYQVSTIKSQGLVGESYTINNVMLAIFSDQTDVDNYLSASTVQYDSLIDFWASYTTAYGSSLTTKAQNGFMLATITCFQPQTIAALVTAIGSNDVSILATWSLATWTTFVSTVCTANNILCVPYCIRGSQTSPTNTQIQSEYAQVMYTITNSLFPLRNIAGQLSGSSGSQIISDSTARQQVITFVTNNPSFDLRVNSVYDINSTSYNLTGISNLAGLQASMTPIQRIIRIVSDPVAVGVLLTNGVDSATAIANMGREQFISTYGYLFPADSSGGGTPSFQSRSLSQPSSTIYADPVSADTAYSTAASIAGVSAHAIVGGVAAMGGMGTAATGIDSKAGTVGQGSAMAYPLIPAFFRGGLPPMTAGDPTLTTVFGNQDYCTCSDCMSMYSPAAYLSDNLHFLQTNEPAAYAALVAKRPDLINIDLSCKNSNTPVPYIDLVNELLELQILQTIPANLPVVVADFSFQTNGTEDQLAAYPEHTYKGTDGNYYDYTAFSSGTPYNSVYNSTNLAGAVYPIGLPFNLPIEESRTYLNHIGISRFDLMQLFLPVNQASVTLTSAAPTSSITNFSLYAEWLGISQLETSIITGIYAPTSSEPYIFYGLTGATGWMGTLSGSLEYLLQQTGIAYNELLQYLLTDYLNPIDSTLTPAARDISITVNSSSVSPSTCQLDELELAFSSTTVQANFYNKFHRFIRLVKTNKLSIYQWDQLLRGMQITNIANDNFLLIGQVLLIADELQISPELLVTWWNSIDTTQYLDYPNNSIDALPSLYATIFSNIGVINDNDATNAFSNPSSFTIPYAGYTGQIASFCNVGEADIESLLAYLGVSFSTTVSLPVLSRLYILSALANTWNYSVEDFITVLTYSETSAIPHPVSILNIPSATLSDYLLNLQTIVDLVNAVKISRFSVSELVYLMANQDPQGLLSPDPVNIQLFYEGIRTELAKNPIYVAPPTSSTADVLQAAQNLLNKLLNIIRQHFTKEFNLTAQLINDILTNITPSRSIVQHLIGSYFVASGYTLTEQNVYYIDQEGLALSPGTTIPYPPDPTDVGQVIPDFTLHWLYDWYRYIYKVSFITNRLKLRTMEFEYFFFNPGATQFSFTSLPISPSGTNTILGTSFSVYDINPFINALLRICRLVDISSRLNFPEDGLGYMLDAVRGILTPAIPGILPPPPIAYPYTPPVAPVNRLTDAGYPSDINTAFNNWLSTILQVGWGTIPVELFGNLTGNNVVVTPSAPPFTTQVSGLLAVRFSSDPSESNFMPLSYDNISMILNLTDIAYWCTQIGLSPTTIQSLLLEDITPSDSRNLIVAVKGKYDNASWAEVAKPIRDLVRVKQRDALVAFTQKDPDAIFAQLLIDVEMEACMLTSRLKQAISSLQLFIDRAILGLEYIAGSTTTILTLSNDSVDQWQDMRKWTATWAANREIFLYPENWLQPELRDDKSVFFEELETFIKQNEATDDNVQDAIMTYLEQLQDIARLEPVGICDEITADGQTITHVFSRTHGASHKYYHRQLTNGLWYPQDRIDINIEGDHAVPFFWNGSLYLAWLTFKEVLAPFTPAMTAAVNPITDPDGIACGPYNNHWFLNDTSSPSTDNIDPNNPPNSYKQIEITLNWSQLKNGKWQNQKISKDKMLIKLNPWMNTVMNNLYTNGRNELEHSIFRSLMDEGHLNIMDLYKMRISVYPYIAGDPTYASAPSSFTPVEGDLYVMVMFPTYFNYWDPVHLEYADYIKAFHFSDTDNLVEVYMAGGRFFNRQIPPDGTFFKNNAMIRNIAGTLNLDSGYATLSGIGYYDYDLNEGNPPLTGTFNQATSNTYMLNSIDSKFSVFTKSGYGNPLEDKFMFEDTVNTYFVNKIPITIFSGPAYVSLGTAAHSTSLFYSTISGATGLMSPSGTIMSGGLAYMGYSYTIYRYMFSNFSVPHVKDFIGTLNRFGVDGLMRPDKIAMSPTPIVQTFTDTMNFAGYSPNPSLVATPYPDNTVIFDPAQPNAGYNAELFFHIPMLIAQRLSENQQFADAQKWYHYIFDPTSTTYLTSSPTPTSQSQLYWKYYPFYVLAGGTIETLEAFLGDIASGSSVALAQVLESNEDPFQPFPIARMRNQIPFMKWVFMKYLDNLIAWGDYLFSQDTLESINEATNIYIQAANLLGPQPVDAPQRTVSAIYCYRELASVVDAIGDASVAIEAYISPSASPASTSGTGYPVSFGNMSYFCLSPNDKLITYWETIADRLYKIRNCENIHGIVQQLPLFDPPINPALLVQAAAAGIDISSVLDDAFGLNTPIYKYNTLVAKANEFCADVKALGSALLSALEKKDAEDLSLLRSGQEISLLTAILQMKQSQIDEANANVDALQKSLAVVQARYDYYSSRPYMNPSETQYLASLKKGIDLQNAQTTMLEIGHAMSLIPQFHLQATFAIGASFGGQQLATACAMLSTKLAGTAAVNSIQGTMASTTGGYQRRTDDWQFQAQSAQKEMTQINSQIKAATIRATIAQDDYSNQQLQINNATQVNAFLSNKYTNSALYDWLISQVSSTYFQAFQLAYGMAKNAEAAYKFELPMSTQAQTGFIKPGYWDSLKKGLQAGETLQYDIRNMEATYLSDNTRTLELTKHISVSMLNPEALLKLKVTGSCTISIPEELYDLDYPTHYNRIVKSISISIPCVAGPYSTVPCTLSHVNSYIRRDPSSGASLEGPISNVPVYSIATSAAQNDNGMFDFNFRDERFLPFEGAGAVCYLGITLGGLSVGNIRPIDYGTISDVIIHIKYTALDGAFDRSSTVYSNLQTQVLGVYPGLPSILLPRLFSLKHEFPNEWYAYASAFPTNNAVSLTLNMDLTKFPFFCEGHIVTITDFYVLGKTNASTTGSYNATFKKQTGTGTPVSIGSCTLGTSTSPVYSALTIGMSPTTMIAGTDSLLINLASGSSAASLDTAFDDLFIVAIYKIS